MAKRLSLKEINEKLYSIRNQLKFSGFTMSELIDEETGRMVEVTNLKKDFSISIYILDFIFDSVDSAVDMIKSIADPEALTSVADLDVDENEFNLMIQQMKAEEDERFTE
jgi:hypothetical protein